MAVPRGRRLVRRRAKAARSRPRPSLPSRVRARCRDVYRFAGRDEIYRSVEVYHVCQDHQFSSPVSSPSRIWHPGHRIVRSTRGEGRKARTCPGRLLPVCREVVRSDVRKSVGHCGTCAYSRGGVRWTLRRVRRCIDTYRYSSRDRASSTGVKRCLCKWSFVSIQNR